MEMKTCTKCRKSPPEVKFHHSNRNKDGLQARCVSCNNAIRAPFRVNTKAIKANIDMVVAIDRECGGDPERVRQTLRERGLIPCQ